MLRKKGLTRYNPFKEFPTKYEEGENILTKVRRILDEKLLTILIKILKWLSTSLSKK